ncbi:Concanavalin A-like lectin/glucanases superfamily protein [Nocardioides alpinus]|uniref:Concanavalin A-like lectin/glucanases superfamily protein n=1 Tax=Nocardioides alpinus TaxID=748909 RepID=A0A1I0XZ22_9ACTN|nr:LamG-like jellyroll fold domain-containing protein [Nocardioides alpinus]PKH42746.1 hypothetical protein CXG46_05645 [Nocardioides alpinus]SFB06369.1 Concanavalin A-like lectin/glucanases superfamily protein [Nocardioides alpinus]
MSRARRTLSTLVALATTAVLGTTLCAPPASAAGSDLAGLWFLDEGSGQVAYDWSFSGNRGQLGSTPYADAQDPAWVSVPSLLLRRSALRFAGSQHLRVANAPSLEPDGVTVVARVRGTAGGTFRYLASKGSLSCETASYGLYTGAQGGLRFYVSDGSTYTLSADAGAGIWDGRWHRVTGAYDGQSVRLWVDGVQVGSPVVSPVGIGYGLPDGEDFLLGDYAGPCGSPLGFVGDIDAAAVIGHYVADPTL